MAVIMQYFLKFLKIFGLYGILNSVFKHFLNLYLEENSKFYSKIKLNEANSINNNIVRKCSYVGANVKINGLVTITLPGNLILGNNVHIGDGSFFASGGGLIIGDNTHISRNVRIYTHNHNYEGAALPYDSSSNYKTVRIGKNVWIGANVCIIPGVTIGDGAIIGMGTVVTKNDQPLSIMGAAPMVEIKKRNEIHYHQLDVLNKYGGKNGVSYEAEDDKVSLDKVVQPVFFIAGTGRSGSQSVARNLSKAKNVHCLHEPNINLIRLSTDYEHRKISRETVKDYLHYFYLQNNVFEKHLTYGESDQKISNLIDIIHEILPASKFVWLIRRADEFVASAVARNWFSDTEANDTHDGAILEQWKQYRLNGYLCGEFSEDQWQKMSVFERCCWYWNYWNSKIEKQFASLKTDQRYMIKLEEFDQNYADLLNFIQYSGEKLTISTYNKTTYSNLYKDQWTEDQHRIYEYWCGDLMNKWYN